MKQLTKEQAVAFYDSMIWKDWSHEEIVSLQLFQDLLCMDFSTFHESISKVLDRSVWTHEFAFRDNLIEEYLGCRDKPSFQDIVNLIPEDKRLILNIS